MNYYCCVHSQSALTLHKELSSKLDGFVDKDVPYKYICGTKGRNDFTTPVINAYDGNPTTPYNKWFRSLTSIYHLLNNVETDRFYFSNTSFFVKKFDQRRIDMFDLLVIDASKAYYDNGELKSHNKFGIDCIFKSCGDKEAAIKFYLDNFGMDLFGKDNYRLQLGCSFINAGNPYMKEWFNRTLEPFMRDGNIRFFNQEIMLIAFAKTYEEYKGKMSLGTGVYAKWYSHPETKEFAHSNGNGYTYQDIHYYGD